jgi:cytochrome P450/NADPH-cytochrome P450 reductase
LIENTQDPAEKQILQDLTDKIVYSAAIIDHRVSVLELMEQFASIDLPFSQFLAMLPPLSPRHYSISSSPLANPNTCTLTYSVIDSPTLSGSGERFHGVTGTYLSTLNPGDQILVSVRSTNKFFRLPTDQEKTPIMMFCAGSGIAPFRGFIQERAVLIKEGKRELAKALLFVGCRSKGSDRVYGEEFDEWAKIGAVDVRYAFSKDPANSDDCKYVQDRLLKDKEDIYKMWDEGAKFYTCGSREVAQGIGQAARVLVAERGREHGKEVSEEMADSWVKQWKNERFVSDVFS